VEMTSWRYRFMLLLVLQKHTFHVHASSQLKNHKQKHTFHVHAASCVLLFSSHAACLLLSCQHFSSSSVSLFSDLNAEGECSLWWVREWGQEDPPQDLMGTNSLFKPNHIIYFSSVVLVRVFSTFLFYSLFSK
jgi:hypothetical protein